MRRRVQQELLDSQAASPEEIQESLADLRRINLRYGGVETMRSLLERVAVKSARRELRVLDVAAGSGDALTQASAELGRANIAVEPFFVDRWAEHIRNAVSDTRIVADAFSLPFGDASFDVVTCSLFLHHLEPQEMRRFAVEALRVARIAFVANDLRRSRIHLSINYLATPTFGRVTRHDAPTSVRRSYTLREARAILQSVPASITGIEMSKHFLFRYGAIVWKT